jgi:glycosyltransferase involved in cell wall biosynthesis
VTVVIPAYNRAASIERAVSSALHQKPGGPTEVIVVDDCSTDETADAARRAGAHVIRHDLNRGAGAARNTAIAHASQPWIAFLDSDDEWLPNHLDALWTARDGHVLLAGAALQCDSGGRYRYIGPVRPGGMVVRSPAEVATLPIITTSGVLVRRDVAQTAGGFRPLHGAEDIDLWLRVLEHGTGYLSPVVSLLYHVHSGQLSSDGFGLQADRREVLRAYSDRSWFTPRLLSDWETSMMWDVARTAERDGDLALAARCLARIAINPVRMRALASVLLLRWRGRRRTHRVARSGAPTIALLGAVPSNRAPEAGVEFTPYEVLRPTGGTRLVQYLSLARRPAAALLVNGAADRLVARILGMHPVTRRGSQGSLMHPRPRR